MSVAKCDDELSRDPKYQHCFEVNTQGRGYLLCAESEAEMEEWIKVFEQIIKASDAAENLVSLCVKFPLTRTLAFVTVSMAIVQKSIDILLTQQLK